MDIRETLRPAAAPRGHAGRPPRRTDVFVDDVRGALAARGLAAVDRLPTEHESAERIGVSRNTVREAVRTLQSSGHVDERLGTCSFAREGVEASLAEPAARRRGDADLAAMRDVMDRTRRRCSRPTSRSTARSTAPAATRCSRSSRTSC
jgi:DNA-binding FadR family transcriptional regulator